MQLCKAKGTLVIPKWKSALFWPMLVDKFTEHFNFVIDFREYKHPMMFFVDVHKKTVYLYRNRLEAMCLYY